MKNTLRDIIKQWSKEMEIHLSQFGKGKNRDIDSREKGTMTITPIVIEKRIKKRAIKVLEENYHPDKTTIPISIWLDFFNIDEDDLRTKEGTQ